MDITKCEGKDCPLKESCYRFTAKEDKAYKAYKSYFAEPPFEAGKCEMFWGESQNGIYNQMKEIMKTK